MGMFFHSADAPAERSADPEVRRANMRRISRLFAPYKVRLGGVLFLIVISAGLGVIPAFLLKRVLEAIGRNDTTALSYSAGGVNANPVLARAPARVPTPPSHPGRPPAMPELRAPRF